MNVVLQIGERPLKPPQGTDPKDERWETLCQLLDWNRYLFHIEHTDGKRSNHLSHYLVALYKLGASDEQLEEAYQLYRQRVPLVPSMPSRSNVNAHNWLEFLGKRKDYLDLVEFFMRELDQRGVADVLEEFIPVLSEGVGSHAFHGVIQLGYGVEAGYLPTIAEGLAYWTYAFTSLGNLDEKKGEGHVIHNLNDAFSVLEAVRADERLPAHETLEDMKGFSPRIEYLIEHHRDYLLRYDIRLPFDAKESNTEALFSLFSLLTAKLFASSGCTNFFMLHLVTGMRALKVSLRASSAPPEVTLRALRYFWRAALFAYIAEGCKQVFDIDQKGVDAISSWDCLSRFRKATSSDIDIHFHPAMKDIVDVNAGKERGPATLKEIQELAIAGRDSHLAKVVFVLLSEGEENPEESGFYDTIACATLERYTRLGWTFFGQDATPRHPHHAPTSTTTPPPPTGVSRV